MSWKEIHTSGCVLSMRLTPLPERHEIEEAFKSLRRTVLRGTETFKGRTHDSAGELSQTPKNVQWNPRYEFSSSLEAHPSRTRYWCAYGTEYPGDRPGRPLKITCEINPPLEGINRGLAGAFLYYPHNPKKRVYYAHSGKLNLVVNGKRLLRDEILQRFENMRPKWDVQEIAQLGKLIILGAVDDPSTVASIARFVHTVERWRRQNGSSGC